MTAERIPIGHVRAIHRFPVKGMRGESLQVARLGWQGLDGDRRFAFLDAGSRSGLPWLSARRVPSLTTFSACLADGATPLIQMDGDTADIWAPRLAEQISDIARRPASAVQLYRGAFDAAALSLISTASVKALETLCMVPLAIERFRANLVVDVLDLREYPEDRWVGKTIGIGDERDAARMRIYRRDPRCAVVNLDPSSGVADPSILRTIVAKRRNQLGVYAMVERPGAVYVGAPLWLAGR